MSCLKIDNFFCSLHSQSQQEDTNKCLKQKAKSKKNVGNVIISPSIKQHSIRAHMNIIWYKEGKNDGTKKKISSQEHYKRGKMKPESTHFDVEFLIEKNIYLFRIFSLNNISRNILTQLTFIYYVEEKKNNFFLSQNMCFLQEKY